MTGADRQEGGFVLAETLAAFVILALGLAVAMEAISQASGALRRAADFDVAATLAPRILAASLAAPAEGTATGQTEDGTQWRLELRPVPDGRAKPMYLVALDVWRDGGGAPYRFVTYAAEAREP